jgi:hypothetical protein
VMRRRVGAARSPLIRALAGPVRDVAAVSMIMLQ